ncbi:MAG: Gfo/Idh/MocA family oxidoreductase [Candidatus Latescibacterota bacterium]|nr:Gfo/Idh/MocA family oxidoreductase [Candidatus Latescibacterota bacterium]
MEKLNLGFIGLGGRGRGLANLVASMDDVHIPAICDLHDDYLEQAANGINEAQGSLPEKYIDYRELLTRNDLDGVIVATNWTSHVEISLAAMRAGIYVASEVGGASSIQECWELVRTSEETGIPFMLLENCCYGREEMAVLNMVKQGLFGELIHCQCGYEHDLRSEITRGGENRHYRLENFVHRNCDLYPTHGIGPIAKILDINKGNRFISLVSMSSKSRGLREYVINQLGPDHPRMNTVFNQGDITTTIIKCANGETVLLTHDCSLPRPYSRAQRVQGTKGLWMEDKNALHFDDFGDERWAPMSEYLESYEHPVWKDFIQGGVKGGHGGMDWLVQRAFIDAIKSGSQTSIDVYDSVTWMAITALSEDSISCGSLPQPFPDFTNGKWIQRQPNPDHYWTLDGIFS